MKPLDGGAVLQMAERANEAYVMANRTQVGAESLSRAARLLETSDMKTSAALLMLCVENLEEDGKDVYASDHHKQLGATLVRAERYQDAAEACVKYGASCARAGQMNSLAKAYLSAIIALLYDGDGVGAQATFNDVHEVPGFDKSEERENGRIGCSPRIARRTRIKSSTPSKIARARASWTSCSRVWRASSPIRNTSSAPSLRRWAPISPRATPRTKTPETI